MRPTLVLLAALAGCGAAGSDAASAVAPSRAPQPVVATPADAERAASALAASIDPSAGLVVVAMLEDASDGEAPPMITTGHRCTREDIARVAALLHDYLAQRRSAGEPAEWACSGDRCELRGMMEFDPTRALRFARDADGSLVVVGVDFFEDVGSSEEYVMETRRQVEREHRRLRAPCP